MPRYLAIVHHDENAPVEVKPELAARMSALYEEITKAGVMLDMGELTSTKQSTKIVANDGKTSYVDGPFTEAKEVVGGYSIVQARDKAEALEWTRRFAEIQSYVGPLTIEVREIVEGSD
ncbi:MAG: transcriptional regulator [Streptosporangiales bacterium]|nr:transcriptional regulator [Streptosporangiales bacterium]